jgi:hypothetical protein
MRVFGLTVPNDGWGTARCARTVPRGAPTITRPLCPMAIRSPGCKGMLEAVLLSSCSRFLQSSCFRIRPRSDAATRSLNLLSHPTISACACWRLAHPRARPAEKRSRRYPCAIRPTGKIASCADAPRVKMGLLATTMADGPDSLPKPLRSSSGHRPTRNQYPR